MGREHTKFLEEPGNDVSPAPDDKLLLLLLLLFVLLLWLPVLDGIEVCGLFICTA